MYNVFCERQWREQEFKDFIYSLKWVLGILGVLYKIRISKYWTLWQHTYWPPLFRRLRIRNRLERGIPSDLIKMSTRGTYSEQQSNNYGNDAAGTTSTVSSTCVKWLIYLLFRLQSSLGLQKGHIIHQCIQQASVVKCSALSGTTSHLMWHKSDPVDTISRCGNILITWLLS